LYSHLRSCGFATISRRPEATRVTWMGPKRDIRHGQHHRLVRTVSPSRRQDCRSPRAEGNRVCTTRVWSELPTAPQHRTQHRGCASGTMRA
jgi:hypothetical protein